MQWFIDNHADVRKHIEISQTEKGRRGLLSLVNRGQLERVLRYLLDESEFLSPTGPCDIEIPQRQSYVLHVNGTEHRVDYEPAESSTGLFGGNSNWRGPVWFPINFLLIEPSRNFITFTARASRSSCQPVRTPSISLGRGYRDFAQTNANFPSFEGWKASCVWRARKISKRSALARLHSFPRVFPWRQWSWIGASHQTGWTGLVAKLLEQSGEAT